MSDHSNITMLLRESFDRAMTLAGVGFLIWNVNTGDVVCTDQVYDLFGIDKDRSPLSIDSTLALLHPDDREIVRKNLHEAIRNRTPYSIDHRVLRNDGEIIWLHAQGELSCDSDAPHAAPLHMLITLIDITDLKGCELLLHESKITIGDRKSVV